MTDETELAYAGADEQARLIREGKVSARELVEATLERIATLNPSLKAYRVVYAEQALAEADEADARRSADARLAPARRAGRDQG